LSEINKIIIEDEYIEIINLDNVLPGDVALYFEYGEITHSAIVISEPKENLLSRKVLSKWGGGEEIIHGERDCPYAQATIKYFRVKLDAIEF